LKYWKPRFIFSFYNAEEKYIVSNMPFLYKLIKNRFYSLTLYQVPRYIPPCTWLQRQTYYTINITVLLESRVLFRPTCPAVSILWHIFSTIARSLLDTMNFQASASPEKLSLISSKLHLYTHTHARAHPHTSTFLLSIYRGHFFNF
jgi:hypothetical protein